MAGNRHLGSALIITAKCMALRDGIQATRLVIFSNIEIEGDSICLQNKDDKIGVKRNEENTLILRGSAMCLHPREQRLKLFHYKNPGYD